MPTVLRVGTYRFFFFAGDREEPQHIHVEVADKLAKFWLNPVRLHSSGGFSAAEIVRLLRLVRQHQGTFLEAWHAYFNG